MGYEKNQRHDKKDNRKQSKSRDYVPVTFVNISLTEKDKKAILDLKQKLYEGELDAIQTLADGGYKVSIRQDESGLSYMVSITGTEDSLNPNICVTSYAGTVWEASTIALYKAHDGKDWLVWEADETPKARWG